MQSIMPASLGLISNQPLEALCVIAQDAPAFLYVFLLPFGPKDFSIEL